MPFAKLMTHDIHVHLAWPGHGPSRRIQIRQATITKGASDIDIMNFNCCPLPNSTINDSTMLKEFQDVGQLATMFLLLLQRNQYRQHRMKYQLHVFSHASTKIRPPPRVRQ